MAANNTSRKTWIIIGVLVSLIAASIAYVLLAQPKVMPPVDEGQSNGTNETPSEQPQPAEPEKPGTYTDYSEAAFAASASSRKLLFFHAQWCPQCRALEQDISAQGVPDDMTIFKVNYDTAASLKQKYGVTLQTTIVEVDANGNLVKKHVAYNQPTLSATLSALGN